MESEAKKQVKVTRGGRNLALMGFLAILIASLTTGISLAIYHNSGDIYLDRSRPGFLPDEEELELEEIKSENYTFEKNGKITDEVLDQYLKKIEAELEIIESYKNPFNIEVLTDGNLF